MNCTRCEGTGFLNIEQVPEDVLAKYDASGDIGHIRGWIETTSVEHDVAICDCCSDGTGWYGEPGQHYGIQDPPGRDGPYAYNGGLCECN